MPRIRPLRHDERALGSAMSDQDARFRPLRVIEGERQPAKHNRERADSPGHAANWAGEW